MSGKKTKVQKQTIPENLICVFRSHDDSKLNIDHQITIRVRDTVRHPWNYLDNRRWHITCPQTTKGPPGEQVRSIDTLVHPRRQTEGRGGQGPGAVGAAVPGHGDGDRRRQEMEGDRDHGQEPQDPGSSGRSDAGEDRRDGALRLHPEEVPRMNENFSINQSAIQNSMLFPRHTNSGMQRSRSLFAFGHENTV